MAISGKFVADFSEFQTAVATAETRLVSFEGGANKVKSALERMEQSLSGKKMIQDAALMVQAVENIGGVSKLTASELERLGNQATATSDKMRAMGIEVPAGLQKISAAAKELHPALSMADKAAGLLQSTFGQFTLANLAATAVSSLTSSLSEFIAAGVKLPAIEASFTRLTGAIKQDGAAMLASMTTATRGMVSNYDLMLSANKAMLLGLPVTADAMGDLAKTATILGQAMGQDATKSLDDLITALGRSSPMILDNLGLTVKVGEANETYAAKLHKTADELTEAEKKTAFYEAAMESARKKTKELGDQTQTLGQMMTSVWTQGGNVVTEWAATMNRSLGTALGSLKGFAEFLLLTTKYGAGTALSMIEIRDKIEQADHAAKAAKNIPAALDDTSTAAKMTTADIEKMREAMLKAEATRVIGPTVVPAVKAVGEAATTTSKAVARLSADEKDAAEATARHNRELERENELLARIAAQNRAISDSGRLYTVDAEGNKHFVGGSLENDLVGRVTPLSERDAANPAALRAMIAALTKSANEWTPPAPDVFRGEESPFAGMPNYMRYQRQQLEAAQKHADDLRQLEYLQQLLSVLPSGSSSAAPALGGGGFGGGGPITFNFNISGVFDQRTIRELRAEFEDSIMTTLKMGRQLGAG